MRARAAHLPEPVVGLVPVRPRGSPAGPAAASRRRRSAVEPGLAGAVQPVQHLAPDVELELVGGGVADPDRRGALVPGQPVAARYSGSRRSPSSAVHDLQVGRVAGDGAQQPLPPGPGLVVVTGAEQRLQGEGGVAQPAVAVVPVAGAAELLGQRGGRGRDDAAGRRVGQRLERDAASGGRRRATRRRRCSGSIQSVQNDAVSPAPARGRPARARPVRRAQVSTNGTRSPGGDLELRMRATGPSPRVARGAQPHRIGTRDGDELAVRRAGPRARRGRSRTAAVSSLRIATRPLTPSTMRTTSAASPRGGMKSTTRTVPVGVSHLVSRTSVSPRYRRRVHSPPDSGVGARERF